jgi:Protein of unknown function (DUF3093)
MVNDVRGERPAAGGAPFDERLRVPGSWLAVATVLALGLGCYFTVYAGSVAVSVLAWVLIAAATQVALWWLGRTRITVVDGSLTVRQGSTRQRVGIEAVHGARAVAVRAALRPGCFAVTRPWIGTGVLLDTEQGRWVLSSRRPDELVEALAGAG